MKLSWKQQQYFHADLNLLTNRSDQFISFEAIF